jgi:hypothetical protein
MSLDRLSQIGGPSIVQEKDALTDPPHSVLAAALFEKVLAGLFEVDRNGKTNVANELGMGCRVTS